MVVEENNARSQLERAKLIWQNRARAFDEAPPEEAAIAALELEAAERRYMLFFRSAKEKILFGKEEVNVQI